MMNIRNLKRIDVLYQFLYFAIFLCLILLSGLRSGIDPDYYNYKEIFKLANSGASVSIEPFYLLLNRMFGFFELTFESLIFWIAFFSISMKYYIIVKKSTYPFFSILIYVTSVYALFDVIALRQGVAIALVMVAFQCEKRHSKFIFLVFIASLFHFSALILLPFFKITRIKHNKYILLFIFVIIFCVTFLRISIPINDFFYMIPGLPIFIVSKFNTYASYGIPSFLSMKQLFVLAIAIYLYLNVLTTKFIQRMALLYLYGCIVSILLGSVGDIAYRIKWYFFFAEIFIVPEFLMLLVYSQDNKKLLSAMVAGFILFIMYMIPLFNFINALHERNVGLLFKGYV